MSTPDEATFRALLEHQDLGLSDARLAQAVANHAGMQRELAALRAVPLSFLEPVLEPGTALAWIERAGVPS
jgi:hypothetical protein